MGKIVPDQFVFRRIKYLHFRRLQQRIVFRILFHILIDGSSTMTILKLQQLEHQKAIVLIDFLCYDTGQVLCTAESRY
jgi:hypothetical protein